MLRLKFWGVAAALLVMVFCVGVSLGYPRQNGLKSVLDLSDMGPVGHPVADGDTMLKHLSAKFGFQLTIVKTPVPITRANLQQYDVVIFNQTSYAGTTLNADEQLALHDYLEIDRGGWIGWHGAGATHATWAWYIDSLIGADFTNHGGVVRAEMYTNLQLATNDTFKIFFGNVPDTFWTSEEWYNLTPNPYNLPFLHMLQYVDEASYGVTVMGPHHPVTWCQIFPNGGRAFYCSRGHTSACFTETTMDSTIWDALQWCGSQLPIVSVAPQENFLHSKGGEDIAKWNFNEPTRLNVYNLAGQLVASKWVKSLAEAQNALPAGCHVVRIMDGSGRTAKQMTVVK
ncbi:MAG TPA: ThuA domain-containing protein [Chitinivibrionales bacterium]|nr:ThuA domain-containing protein [Chitinivibrionales bacterium]